MQLRLVVPLLGSLALLTACNPYDTTQRTVGGGVLGAGSGAAIGALAGGGRGAAIGSLAGGVVGAATGYLTTPQNQNRYGQTNQGYYPNQATGSQGQGYATQNRYTPQQVVQTPSAYPNRAYSNNQGGDNRAYREPYQNGYAAAPNGSTQPTQQTYSSY
ncbi:YMGG-like glycine zipper-containing protein [Gluconobacter sp. Dm-44]|uniref:YMGG-like glycine zipper-containing protein n=1 Tax=Gluconobacter sp. Dm-44 TaxID=2799805 RepID=UPI001B8C3986|nr:YMGG-like glycine zipper-containing protein [Gluconobacter sp. Dm-44]MBS1061174.1 hypothetical protein [Gluconobacter sp. Dm-44]